MKLNASSKKILWKLGYFSLIFAFLVFFSTSSLTGCFGTPEKLTNSSVTIIPNNNTFLELDFSINDYELKQVEEGGTTYTKIVFKDGVFLNKKGYAELPSLHASIQLPRMGAVEYEIIKKNYIDIPLAHPVLPSKGIIYRNQNPGDIPREIALESFSEKMYPKEIATLSDPYIFRDVRGANLHVYPFRYDAVGQILRVYTNIQVSFNHNSNAPSSNVMMKYPEKIVQDMKPIYNSMFINYGSLNNNMNIRRSFSNEIAEFGEILVLHTSRDASAILPYVQWKRQLGYKVHTKEVNRGTYVESIIRNEYNANNNLLYVQLVGDWADIKSELGTSQNAPMDPMLGCVVGYDDYPDLIIGRFSAENTAHVTAQINKSINYEKNPDMSGTWYKNALGLGSSEGPGDDSEKDYSHIDNIHNYRLKATTYSNTFRYTDGDSYTKTRDAVNGGVSIINYCGHGDWNKFITTSFDNADVSALTNENKLPFIISVACLNGKFHSSSVSFAETWLRKENGGAVATLMSTINQPWQPPMRGQDYMNDLLIGGYNYSSNPGSGTSTTEGRTTFGAITFNGMVLMLSEKSYSDDLDTIKTWTLFGDAAVQVRTDTPKPISISNKVIVPGQTFNAKVTSNGSTVSGARVAISQGANVFSGVTNSSGNVSISHNLPGGTAKLVVSGFNLATLVYNVTVGDDDGSNNPPVSGFTYTKDKLQVTFTDTSEDYEGPIASRQWNFGDGNTSTVVNPVHTYAEDGTYEVSLLVTDSEGLTGTYSEKIEVSENEEPNCWEECHEVGSGCNKETVCETVCE